MPDPKDASPTDTPPASPSVSAGTKEKAVLKFTEVVGDTSNIYGPGGGYVYTQGGSKTAYSATPNLYITASPTRIDLTQSLNKTGGVMDLKITHEPWPGINGSSLGARSGQTEFTMNYPLRRGNNAQMDQDAFRRSGSPLVFLNNDSGGCTTLGFQRDAKIAGRAVTEEIQVDNKGAVAAKVDIPVTVAGLVHAKIEVGYDVKQGPTFGLKF